MKNAFRSLSNRNYRLYFSGQLVSLVGTWMQIIGQSWLVWKLTGSGLNVGIVTGLQFGPMLIGGAWGGLIADRYPKRRILIITQAAFAVFAGALALVVTTGIVELWMVYALAFLYGTVQVVDMPTRQAFVPEMVAQGDVINAVSLNTAVFNGARLVGPAIAGLVIKNASIGVCFWANSISFAAVIIALLAMRDGELHASGVAPVRGRGQIRAGFRYAMNEPDVLFPLILVAVIGTLGFNFQIVLPMLADVTFHGDAGTYGAMSSIIAIGSVCGAMFAATRHRPSKRLLIGAALALGVTEIALGFAPTLLAAYLILPAIGLAMMLFIPTANSMLQLSSTPEMRGRVLGLFSLLFLGSAPIGGPLVGWMSEVWSPRAALYVGGAATMGVAVVVGGILRSRHRAETAWSEAHFEEIPATGIVEPVAVGESRKPLRTLS